MKTKISIIVLCVCLFSFSLLAKEYRDINVYVTFSSGSKEYMVSFNNYLEAQGILKKYNIVPFIRSHPVHLSLYLTTYDVKNLPAIIETVKKLSVYMKRFKIKATNLEASAGNWVLYNVDNSKLEDGNNNPLQVYADAAVNILQNFRYKQATIPSWANAYPEKKQAFYLYGSPNVYMQFNPHFSVYAANIPKSQEKEYQSDITKCIKDFPSRNIESVAQAICVGYVDTNGQVTEELASFPLK
ncbi:MAG: hypothetical protein A2X47_00465 [Lentisphaerae bacterium GWF2_38_69]|nr:MAG: hypothetical protein A2X47_00465 [Lentisphaerae bacterium GWF2_38_69]